MNLVIERNSFVDYKDFDKGTDNLVDGESKTAFYVRVFCCAALTFEVCLEMYVHGTKTPGLLRFFTIWGMLIAFATFWCAIMMYKVKENEKFKKAYVIIFELAISFGVAITIGFWGGIVPKLIE